jgi:hypothetical protein
MHDPGARLHRRELLHLEDRGVEVDQGIVRADQANF